MKKIVHKVLFAVILSVSSIMVMFLSQAEYDGYLKSVQLLKGEQRLITEGNAVMLSEHIRTKNDQQVLLVISGMLANPKIVGARIINENGQKLFAVGDTDNRDGTFSYKHPITYFADGKIVQLAKLVTVSSDAFIVAAIKSRVMSLSLMALMVVLAITISVAFTVRYVVEEPVRLLVQAFSSDSEGKTNSLSWSANDEMGLLISGFNRLNSRVHMVVDDLRAEIRDHEVAEAERMKCLADATFEGVVILREGIILDVNEAACSLLGKNRSELIAKDLEIAAGIVHIESDGSAGELDKPFREQKIQLEDGRERTIEVTGRSIVYAGNNAWVVALRDVTERIASKEKIEFLAHCDHLTGLSNRFKLDRDLNDALLQAPDGHMAGVLMCLDLDGFKGVNDYGGHASGDELLRQVGARLRSMVSDGDVVARLGGDEFAVAIFQRTNIVDVQTLANRFIEELGRIYVVNSMEFKIGVSVGIAFFHDSSQQATDFIKKADLALYEAKRVGKGQFKIYAPHMEAIRLRGLRIENGLRAALRNGTLDVNFQPQVDTHTRRVTGFEALARWTDDSLGVVGPDEFIPIAEQSGLIAELGEFVLRKACRAAQNWPDECKVAVNISPAEFANANLATTVESILNETKMDPKRLELEITESALMQDDALTMTLIQRLKKLGIAIVIDDFGTGYSSLGFLLRYPFDRIKIDKSFTFKMEESQEAKLIVRSIINLGTSLGIGVIAEGVEDENTLGMLRMEGCDQVQGYLIGRAEPEQKLHKYFQTERELVQLAS